MFRTFYFKYCENVRKNKPTQATSQKNCVFGFTVKQLYTSGLRRKSVPNKYEVRSLQKGKTMRTSLRAALCVTSK